jgi:ABC-2 type transport system permease protein
MIQLLKIEWLKIKNYKAFIIIASCFALGVVSVNYIVYTFKKNVIDLADPTGIISSTSPFAYPSVWQTVSYYSGWLLLLPGMLLLILVTNEFTYRTHRQNIIDGWDRMQFTHVKLVMGIMAALASTLLVILTVFIFGAVTGSSFSFTGAENIGYFLLKAVTYNFVAVLLGVLIRRTGFAIAVYFIYTVLENGIALLLYAWAFDLKEKGRGDFGNMGNYLPMNASDGLLYSPLDKISNLGSRVLPADYTWLVLSLAIAYLGLFYWWSRRRMTHSDL